MTWPKARDEELLGVSDRTPGWVFYSVGIAISTAIVVAASSWSWLWLILMVWPVMGFGLFWLVVFATASRSKLQMQRGVWLRWLGIPGMGLLCLILVCTALPFRARFELSRSDFQAAERRVTAGDELAPGSVGLFEVDGSMRLSNGVYFRIESAGLITACGVAFSYSGTGRPDMPSLDADLGGGWWFACEGD